MITKFGKTLNAIIFAFIVSTAFNACSHTAPNANLTVKTAIDPKIVGSWKNTDEKITSIQSFSANGDWQLESADKKIRHNGKFEIKNGSLLVSLYDENGQKPISVDEYKIAELTDNSMTYVLPTGVKMFYRKIQQTRI